MQKRKIKTVAASSLEGKGWGQGETDQGLKKWGDF